MSKQPMWVQLMSCLAASRVRIFPLLAIKPELRLATEADYGLSSLGLLAIYDPDLCCWKMSQPSLLPGVTPLLSRLPKSGMTHNGRLYALPILVHRTNENAGSAWPTPKALMIDESVEQWQKRRAMPGNKMMGASLIVMVKIAEQNWPSPVASDAVAGAIIGADDTYYETDGLPRKINRNGTDGSVGLGRLVKMLPGANGQRNPSVALNPDWEEGLMGFPAGWTDVTESAAQTITRNAGLPTAMSRNIPMSRGESPTSKRIAWIA